MFENLFIGIVGSMIAAVLGFWVVKTTRRLKNTWNVRYNLARALQYGGITRFTLSRRDYSGRPGSGPLRHYLATASHSIDIVSISMNVTQAEGSLISLFEQRINESATFRVRVTLLNPDSPVVSLLAKSLDLKPQKLQEEIIDTLHQLWACKCRLSADRRKGLEILTHDTLPIGSAILLDASPDRGRIQLETKLYQAPRIESFGFEISAPSDFFSRNYEAWQRVFNDSKEYVPGSLRSGEAPLFHKP